MSKLLESGTVAALALAIVLAGLLWLAWTGIDPFLDLVDAEPTAAWLACGWLIALIVVLRWIRRE